MLKGSLVACRTEKGNEIAMHTGKGMKFTLKILNFFHTVFIFSRVCIEFSNEFKCHFPNNEL